MDAEDFRIEAYGTVTPPPEQDGGPDEGDGQDEEE